MKRLKYLLPLVGSFLATMAGQGFKYLRRFVLPIILATIGVICLGSLWGITLGFFGVFTSIGYGIPDPTDIGSTLGRFWYRILKGKHAITDVFVRGTIGLGLCLTGLVCPILKGNWLMYFIGCCLIMIGQTVFSYRGWGFIPFKGKELLWSDLINYGLIFTGYLIMLS